MFKEQVSKFALNAPYQRKGSGEKSMIEMAKSYDLSWSKHKKIAKHCEDVGIIYMSSCFDKSAVDFLLDQLNGDCIKIGSGELTNNPLLRYIAKKDKPIILSTGMSTLEDVKGAVHEIKSNGSSPIILLHCVSNYPTPEEEVNLRAMITLKEEFSYKGEKNNDLSSYSMIFKKIDGTWKISWMQRSSGTTDLATWN